MPQSEGPEARACGGRDQGAAWGASLMRGAFSRSQSVRTMLTPKVTPIRHTGPSPYAPLPAGSTARK